MKSLPTLYKSLVLLILIGVFAYRFFQERHPIEVPAIDEKYSRSDYKHWIDANHDCQNTRNEVLIYHSIDGPVLDFSGCRVVSGKWYDPYTNQYFTDPKQLDIDHFIPLGEVDRSGGHQWSREKKMEYANSLDDLDILIPVSKSANRSKGDKYPSEWLPANQDYVCEYLKKWKMIKQRWLLAMDKKESNFVELGLSECSRNMASRQY